MSRQESSNSRIKGRNYHPDKFEPSIGSNLPDPFFDSYDEEVLTCWTIMNLAGLQSQKDVTLTFNRAFLKRIVKSHIKYIQQLAAS